ncbi:hypothetical protein [Anaeromyxobacter sp. PSR-1]|uniref:hypothetical protein n=1 Tax=Anaeromyxobacter sp. PSR-1 TaxID=1300915 RepID=UPI0005E94F64|nr:hypothetical protein [Anaeromyxobacter sp. PSR-1]GAO01828.1 hypothetical protein PSR1_00689 [Anaeromyxobacter sp. PSR-1]
MTTKTYELRASAVRAAKKAGHKEGDYEVVQVWESAGKSHWEWTPKEPPATSPLDNAPASAATPPAEAPKLVVQDYADQPKSPPVATTPAATPPASPAPAKPEVAKPSKSTVEKPTKAVWAMADEMRKANPQATRKEIVDECIRRGIAFYTARTQYQRWAKSKKPTNA